MLELQDIFRLHGKEYRETHKLSLVQSKAMSAIEHCRTSLLGRHMDVCENCGNTQISYNSCRNRHCQKCQTLSKEWWIENQKHNLLNIGYFHVVFTITKEDKTINHRIASERIYIEHTNCRLKRLRIIAEHYRNRRKRLA